MFVKLASTNNKYEIDENATVRKVDDQKVIAKWIGIDGYEFCTLFLDRGKYRPRVHRLMAEVFFNNHAPIDHINMDRGDNRLENLRAISYAENNHKRRELVGYRCVNKISGLVIETRNSREAEKKTGVDRHRIKTFAEHTQNNYSDWEFEKV